MSVEAASSRKLYSATGLASDARSSEERSAVFAR